MIKVLSAVCYIWSILFFIGVLDAIRVNWKFFRAMYSNKMARYDWDNEVFTDGRFVGDALCVMLGEYPKVVCAHVSPYRDSLGSKIVRLSDKAVYYGVMEEAFDKQIIYFKNGKIDTLINLKYKCLGLALEDRSAYTTNFLSCVVLIGGVILWCISVCMRLELG